MCCSHMLSKGITSCKGFITDVTSEVHRSMFLQICFGFEVFSTDFASEVQEVFTKFVYSSNMVFESSLSSETFFTARLAWVVPCHFVAIKYVTTLIHRFRN